MKKTIQPEYEEYKSKLGYCNIETNYGTIRSWSDGSWWHKSHNEQGWNIGEWWFSNHYYRIRL